MTPPNPQPPQGGEQTAFQREPRYLVTKIKDAVKYLSPKERDTLERLSAKCGLGRIDDGKRNLNCLVIESDWPEFEPTWAAIEARMTGKPSDSASLSSRVKELEAALEGVTNWAETIEVIHAHPFLNNRAIVEARALLSSPSSGKNKEEV